MRLLVLLLLAVSLLQAEQTETTVHLDGSWAMQKGDDPAWAEPGFNDSGWEKITAGEFARVRVPASQRDGIFWYRLRTKLPPDRNLAVELGPIDGAYEVYLNGEKAGGMGSFPPHLEWFSSRSEVFRVPPNENPGELLIAVRVYRWKMAAVWPSLGMDYTPHLPALGSVAALEREVTLRRERTLFGHLPVLEISLLCLVAGLIALELYRRDRSEIQHLWLGISFVFTFLDGMLALVSANSTSIPVLPFEWLDCPIVGIKHFAAILFLGTYLSRKWQLAVRALAGVMLLALVMIAVSTTLGDPRVSVINDRLMDVWLALSVILGLLVAVRATVGRVPDALPLVTGVTAWEASVIIAFRLPRWFPALRTQLEWGPFTGRFSDLGVAIFAVCMFYVLVRRFLRMRQERELLGREFEAARSVQALLVPSKPPLTPGFVVDADYRPALEVGGDFFQILPGQRGGKDDGTVLVVVGDVSGKGLKAAILVAHIVGGLRHETSRRPSEVLAHLNHALEGQTDGGFVTCACALLDRAGWVTIANAGHLYPYCNGEEMEVASGLPLGLIANGSYPETRFPIRPGDRLTFVSDGVVEARNSKGELFGFDRTRDISMQAAAKISEAARAFGQEDDITVVTVAVQPV